MTVRSILDLKPLFDLVRYPFNIYHWSHLATSMLETKCFDDNYKRLVTALAIWVINIHLFTLASDTNIHVTNIEIQSPTSTNRHQLQVININLSPTSLKPSHFLYSIIHSLTNRFSVGQYIGSMHINRSI